MEQTLSLQVEKSKINIKADTTAHI